MAEKIPPSSGLGPTATTQGWFTWNYWSSLFTAFFTRLQSFVWTSEKPIHASPFPKDVTLRNVQDWLVAIDFETKVSLAEHDVKEGHVDAASRRIPDLQSVVQQVREKMAPLLNCEDWTLVTNQLGRVDLLAGQILAIQPSYPQIEKRPLSPSTILESFGITNYSGNDCFINATLQILFSSPYLVQHIVFGEGQRPLVQQVYQKWRHHYEQGTKPPGDLTNILRTLHPMFKGCGQHDIGEFFLHALIAPLKKEGNPLFFKRLEMTKYKDVNPDELKEKEQFQGNYKVREELASTVQLIIPPVAKYPTIQELIAASYQSSHVEGTVDFERNVGEKVKLEMEERKFVVDPPEFLFIDIVRHSVVTQEFSGQGTFRGRKNDAGIAFQTFFFIPPEQTIDGKGAKYEWISIGDHGGGFGGGHYTAYVRHQDEIHYYSDTTKTKKTESEFLAAGQRLYFGFARRVDCEDIPSEMEEARRKGETDKEIGFATYGKYGEAKYMALIQLFNKELSKEPPDLNKLQKVYDQLDTQFKDFIATFLQENPRDHLLKLKEIIAVKLGTDLSGHIVAQYEKVRSQNIQIARDLIKEKTSAEAEKRRLEFLQSIDLEAERLKIAKILDPGLEKVLKHKTIEQLLEDNAIEFELIARKEATEAFRQSTERVDF